MAAIVIDNLSKRYGSVEALKGVSLSVPDTGVFGLIGPNGAGKTTLLSLVLGELDPTSGSIEVLGSKPSELHRQRGLVAAMPQDAALPPTVTIEQGLRFFAELSGLKGSAAKADVDRVLEAVDLAKWRKARVQQLSHGMAKRVGIAQILLGKPKLVILDEPTAGLDPKHAHDLQQHLRALGKSCAVVVSSHNLNELEEISDHAAILVRGSVARAGAMKDVRRADAEVNIELASAAAPNAEALKTQSGALGVSYDADKRLLTARFAASSDGDAIDRAVTALLRGAIEQGLLIREVRRGQSLMTTFLELV